MGGLVDPPPAQAIGLEKAPDISADRLALKWQGVRQGQPGRGPPWWATRGGGIIAIVVLVAGLVTPDHGWGSGTSTGTNPPQLLGTPCKLRSNKKWKYFYKKYFSSVKTLQCCRELFLHWGWLACIVGGKLGQNNEAKLGLATTWYSYSFPSHLLPASKLPQGPIKGE